MTLKVVEGYLIQIKVFVRRQQSVLVPELLVETSQQLVEHVIVPFLWRLRDYPTLFEEILRYPSPYYHSAGNNWRIG